MQLSTNTDFNRGLVVIIILSKQRVLGFCKASEKQE
jgi:hypothetical protein